MIVAKDMMNFLPDELLLKIFQYVDKVDLVQSVQHVSPRWRVIAQDKSLWQDYMFSPSTKTSAKDVSEFLGQSPQLKSFTMSSEMNANNIVDTLCKKCKELKTLKITMSSRLNIRVLKGVFTRIPSLECLQVSQVVKLAPKNTIEKCMTVKLRSPKEIHPQMEYYSESLNFGRKVSSFIDVIKYILKRKREDIISLKLNVITDDILKLVQECSAIEKLRLEFDLYQDTLKANLEFIRKLPCLNSLAILNYFNDNLLHDLFSKGVMNNILELDLSWCIDLSDKVAKSIQISCPNLERLTFECCFKLTDKGIHEVAKCSKLRQLKISSCPLLTAESVKHVSKCRGLVHLDLTSYLCEADKYVGHLLLAKQLRVLILKGNLLTDSHIHAILVHLKHLTQLRVDAEKKPEYSFLIQ